MRSRFLSGDAVSRSDAALLELLLTYAIPQRDVQPLAGTRLARFEEIGAGLAADAAVPRHVAGIKETDTFPVLRRKEQASFGEYRSRRRALDQFERFQA